MDQVSLCSLFLTSKSTLYVISATYRYIYVRWSTFVPMPREGRYYLSVSSLHIYTFVVSRAFMAGAVSQAGDADSRAPGLTSGLQGSVNVHRGGQLFCWCDSASVLLYFSRKCIYD